MSRISCVGITKTFGSTRVLDELSLEVPDGTVVTVLGESGSGKTTLLRLIAGFERPDVGMVALGGEVVDSARHFVPPERRRIGYVAQEGNLFPHLNVARNIAFGLSRRERSGSRVEGLLGLVGLEGLGGRFPHQLSGGQQQRVALARALAPRPQVILLDEPFSSLDASLRATLRREVTAILREHGTTSVFVTHDQDEALSISDFVGIMDAGRIRQFSTPQHLYDHPVDASTARFVGDANLVPGTASSGIVATQLGELTLVRECQALEGPVLALIRPEQIALRPLGTDREWPTGRVIRREYYGHDSMFVVMLDGSSTSVRIRIPGRSPAAISSVVVLTTIGQVVAWPAPEGVR